MQLPPISEFLGVVRKDDTTFESQSFPARMGNANEKLAYGGCAQAFGVHCACATVNPGFFIYTVLGSFLGPVSTERKLTARIDKIRDTRTFATRKIEIYQQQDDGKDRMVMYQVADFQAREKASLLVYSAKPLRPPPPPDQCYTFGQREEEMRRQFPGNKMLEKLFKIHNKMFEMFQILMDMRVSPDSVFTQNMTGLFPSAKTTQDDLDLTDKVSGDWIKTRESLGSVAENTAALALIMDGALSFTPLAHTGQFLDAASACSSLEFALRFFSNDLALDKFHYRELRTICGGEGRTYTESRLWDEGGKLVANMTQQSIMRPKASESKL